MQYKIGDEVVLRPETKPYTWIDGDLKVFEHNDSSNTDKMIGRLIVVSADNENITVQGDNGFRECYLPKHLKHAKEDTAFEDYHEKLHQQYSDSFNDLESDVKAELEKLKDIDLVELRLAIFNGDTSRTLEEMKAIEAWLLGESK